MIFRMGRKDLDNESDAGNAVALTGRSHENAVQVAKFDFMGLTQEEYVALMGSYTIGFANDENKTRNGRWTQNPNVFDNTYFQELLLRGDKYLATDADYRLLNEPALLEWVEKFANDQNLFFESYARAHVRVSEMGQEENLLSEFNDEDIINGGYQENQGTHWAQRFNEYVSKHDGEDKIYPVTK